MFSWHHQKLAAKFGLDLEIWWETSHCVVELDLGSLKALLWFVPDLCFLGCLGPHVLASLACYVLREGLMSPSWFRDCFYQIQFAVVSCLIVFVLHQNMFIITNDQIIFGPFLFNSYSL